MILMAEIEVNPAPGARFVAEMRLEKNKHVIPGWWGLWFGWWLYRGRWKHWLYGWEHDSEGDWYTWQVRLLGFAVCWQRRRYVR